ncbi:MAG: DUF1573 domain-containing protein [Muribaculaceae bacterium]|nr:DUF1573 domain-containing protein [Muribaculaceae bacterium]
MNRIVSLILALAATVLPALSAKTPTKAPEVCFEETVYDFGTIKESDGWIEHEFQFTNIGTAPLAIVTVSASCGCTKPEFPHKPVAAGKSGKIKIRFTPEGLKGAFTRTAKVRTNIKGKKGNVILTIKGTVIPK